MVPAREVEVSPGDERKLPMVNEYELIVPEGKVAKSLIYGSQLGKNTRDRELERLCKPIVYPSTWVSHTRDDGKLLIKNRNVIRLVGDCLSFLSLC